MGGRRHGRTLSLSRPLPLPLPPAGDGANVRAVGAQSDPPLRRHVQPRTGPGEMAAGGRDDSHGTESSRRGRRPRLGIQAAGDPASAEEAAAGLGQQSGPMVGNEPGRAGPASRPDTVRHGPAAASHAEADHPVICPHPMATHPMARLNLITGRRGSATRPSDGRLSDGLPQDPRAAASPWRTHRARRGSSESMAASSRASRRQAQVRRPWHPS